MARVGITLFTVLCRLHLAKYHFKAKNLALSVILIQIMIPFQVGHDSNYLIVVNLVYRFLGAHHPLHGR